MINTENPKSGFPATAELGRSDAVPKRVQLSRRRGYRKPEGAVIVARPSKWGNPFPVGSRQGAHVVTPELAVKLFSRWLDSTNPMVRYAAARAVILRDLHELAGRDLACWCPLGSPCHADELLRRANGGSEVAL